MTPKTFSRRFVRECLSQTGSTDIYSRVCVYSFEASCKINHLSFMFTFVGIYSFTINFPNTNPLLATIRAENSMYRKRSSTCAMFYMFNGKLDIFATALEI